jgi:hypothetical protein
VATEAVTNMVRHGEGGTVGYSQSHTPAIIEAETLLEAAMSRREVA